MFDRQNPDNNHFWGYLFYVYLSLIWTTDNSKQGL